MRFIKFISVFEGVAWYIQFVLNSLYSLTQEGETCTTDKVEQQLTI